MFDEYIGRHLKNRHKAIGLKYARKHGYPELISKVSYGICFKDRYNSKGERLTPKSISTIVKQRLIDAGYNSDRLTAHSLRHTAVTLSLIGGLPLEEVQQFARHKNISTTQIYAHNLDRAKNRSEDTIANSIFEERQDST